VKSYGLCVEIFVAMPPDFSPARSAASCSLETALTFSMLAEILDEAGIPIAQFEYDAEP
jgi:hypothetical protein